MHFIMQTKDAALNIAIAQSIVLTVLGHEVDGKVDATDLQVNAHCDDKCFDEFLSSIIRMVADPNPASRHSTGIWLLALVKNCAKRAPITKRIDVLQYAFTELLSDDSGKLQIKIFHSINDFSLFDKITDLSMSIKKITRNVDGFQCLRNVFNLQIRI